MKTLQLMQFFLGILFLFMFTQSHSQTTITLGTGTSYNSATTNPAPFGNYFWGNKEQYLITATEFQALGFSSGMIHSMSLNVFTMNNCPALNNFTIKIGSSSSTNLPASGAFHTTLSQVYTTSYLAPVVGWNTFNFSTPYYWDGSSNIVIEVCFNNGSYITNGNASTYYSTTSHVSSQYYRNDNGTVCVNTTGAGVNIRPNFKFSVTPGNLPNDFAMVNWVSPVNNDYPSNSKNITIKFTNNDSVSHSNIPLMYSINGGLTWTTEVYTSTVNFRDTITYTFSAPANMAANGYYNCIAKVAYGSDTYNSNDTIRRTVYLCQPMMGHYTVGSGGNYATISDAISAFSYCGVGDTVFLDMLPGTYTGSTAYYDNGYTTEFKPLVIQSSTGNPDDVVFQYASTSSADNYVIFLNNAKYMIFKNITFKNTSTTGTYGSSVLLGNNANYNQFINCKFKGIQSNSSSNYSSIVSCLGYYTKGNKFINNTFEDGSFSIYFIGNSSSFSDSNVFEGNNFLNFYYSAVYLNYQKGISISKNVFNTNSNSSGIYYIYMNYVSNGVIERNKLMYNESSLSNQIIGIYCYYNQSSLVTPLNITNNFISFINSSGSNYGIYLYYSYYQNIANNSIYLQSSSTGSSPMYVYYGSNNNIHNNVFYNNGNGYAMYTGSGSYLYSCDYNDYYTAGSYLAYWGGNISTLTSLKSTSLMNTFSLNINPDFYSITDLHTNSVGLNGAGVPLSYVALDFDGQPRSASTPDIGADEYTPLANDAGVTLLAEPMNPCPSTSSSVKVKIKNFGTSVLTSATIGWQVDGNIQSSVNWTGSIATGSETTITLGTYSFGATAINLLKAYPVLINGVADLNGINDTLNTNVKTSLNTGSYTIGGASANYPTITAAINDLTNRGVCGPVVFKIADGVYDEQLVIGSIPGASSSNTISFESLSGDSSKVKITTTTSNASTYNYVLLLDNADFITFSNISFEYNPYYSSYTNIVLLQNGSTNNNFNKVHFIGNPAGTNVTNSIIYASNYGNNYYNFTNCTFDNNCFGFYLVGNSSNYVKGYNIINNVFNNNMQYGIYLNYVDSSVISKNFISNTNSSNSYSFSGIYVYYSGNTFTINKNNIISKCPSGNPLSLSYLIGTSAKPILVYNNNIVKENGASYTNRGAYIYYCTYLNFNSNTIRFRDSYTSGSAVYCYYGTYNTIRNNNVVNTGYGYALYTNSTTNIVSSDYNNWFTSGTYLAYWGGSRTTLSALRTYSGKDTYSKSLNPTFIDNYSAHLFDMSLNNSGTYNSLITDDIDDELRNTTTPDIGADEFSIQNYDLSTYSIVAPGTSTAVGTKPVKVSIRNMGLNTLTSATISYKLDGNTATNYSWTGSIATLGIDSNINIGNVTLSYGSHTLKVWTSNPNGISDQNKNNDTLSIQLFASPKPEILVVPSSISKTINVCNDSVTVPIKIYNVGSASLNYVTDSASNGVTRVLGVYLGATYSGDYTATKNALFSQLTNYSFSETATTDPATFASLLNNADVVVFGSFTTSSYYSVYQSFATALQNFVNNGGGVVFTGSSYYYYYSYTGLLNIATTYSLTSGYTLDNLVPSHPIMAGLPANMNLYNNTYYHQNSDASYTSLLDLTNYPSYGIAGYRNLGLGRVVYIGYTFTNYDATTAKLLTQAVKWAGKNSSSFIYNSAPYSGTIAAGDSTTVNIKLKSTGFTNGVYTSNFNISSNDSSHLITTIPVTLTVNGTPSIAMIQNPFNKGSVFTGASYYDTLKVYNLGCDSLRITNVVSNQGALVPQTTSRVIAPKDTSYLVFKYSPVSAGNFTANVSITNNASAYTLVYNANATLPPTITVTPNPLNATITYCNDSILVPVTIANTGSGTLNVTNSIGGSDDTVRILGLTYGYYSTYYTNMLSIINSLYPKNSVTSQSITTATALQTALVGKDMVIIPYMNNDYSATYATFATTLQNFVNNGGTVLYSGQYYSNYIFNTGLLSGTYYGYNSYSTINVLNNTHVITQGFPASYTNNGYFSYLTISTSGITKLATYNTSYDMAVVKNMGLGKVIYLASWFDNNITTYYENIMLGNAVKFVAQNKIPDWANFTQNAVNVNGGNNTQVNIRFRSAGKTTGQYISTLRFTSNDPATPVKSVPCTLNIQNTLPNMVNLGNDTTVCGNVSLNAGTGYTNYIWSTGATSSNINVTSTGSYAVTVSNGGICSDRDTITVIVNPLPTVNFTGLPTNACTNGSTITLSGTPAGGSFVGAGMSGNVFNPANSGTGFKTITYVYTNAQNCTNSNSKMITVNDPPTVLFSGLNSSYCPGSPSSTLIGAPVGGTFSGPGVNSNVFNPLTAGAGNHEVIYSYTDVSTSCSNKDTNSTIVYQPANADILGLSTSYCQDAPSVSMSSNFSGGVYTGNGVSGNIFSPSSAGVGTHSIRYNVTDNHGCATGDTINVTVHALPSTVSITGLSAGYCATSDSILMSGTPSGGVFSGNGVSGNYFRPIVVGPGSYKVKYTYTNSNGCSKSDSTTVNVYSMPVITISGLQSSYCLNSTNANVTALPTGGTLSGTGLTGSIFQPSIAGVGNHTIRYSFTNSNGCMSKDSVQVIVNALPIVNFTGLGTSYCKNAASVNLVGSPIGGTFSGSGVNGTVFNPLNANTGAQQVSYTYTDLNNCVNSISKSVTIFPIPVVNAGSDITITNGAFTALAGTVSGGTGTFNTSWTPSNLVVNPNSLNTNTVSLSSTTNFTLTAVDAGYGCQNSDIKVVTVTGGPLSAVATANPQTICSGSFTQLSMNTSGGSGNYTYSWTSNPSGFVSTISNPIVSPSVSTTYSCIVNDGTNQTSSSIGITVNPKPNVTITGLSGSYCTNEPIVNVQVSPVGGTLTGSGISGLTFNPATASLSTFNVIYAYMDGFGCFNSDTVSVTVKSAPSAYAGQDTSLPCGHPGVMIGQQPISGVSYLWTPGLGLSNVNNSNTLASPNLTIDYILTATSTTNSCTAIDTVHIDVTGTPTATAIGDTLVCPGTGVNLSVSGGTSYLWASGDTTASITVHPLVTTNYWVIAYDGNCADSDTVTVEVNNPNPQLGADTSMCSNRTWLITAKSGYTAYLWSNGSTGQSFLADSIGVGYGIKTIWCQVTDALGCIGSDTIKVDFLNCTSVEQITDEINLSVIPNPNKGQFRIYAETTTGGEISFEIYDMRSKLLLSEKQEANQKIDKTFDLSTYPKGIYLLKAQSQNKVITKRIVVQ